MPTSHGFALLFATPFGGGGSASTGSHLTDIKVLSPRVLRLGFSAIPQQFNPMLASDGLNPANYALTGPKPLKVTSVSVVADDPHSLDLHITPDLTTGAYSVSASSILTPAGAALDSPTGFQFAVVISSSVASVGLSDGFSSEGLLRKHLDRAYTGPFIDGIIAALASGDHTVREQARLAADQLHISTASDIYLTARAGDVGVTRNEDVGLDDELFRQLAILLKNQRLTEPSLYQILEIYYGKEAVHAHVATGATAPFALVDGDELSLWVDERQNIVIRFDAADFNSIGAATAIEVAASISRQLRQNLSNAWAEVGTDPSTGADTVVIYSPSRGLSSFLRIDAGFAQTRLQFPLVLTGVTVADTWVVTTPSVGVMRVTISGATTTDLSKIRVGDYVNIIAGTNFLAANQGSFVVTAVDRRYSGATLNQYFEVQNPAVVAQASVVMIGASDMMFFRSQKVGIDRGQLTLSVTQTTPGTVDISLPATSNSVRRAALDGAAYLQAGPELSPTSFATNPRTGDVTFGFATAHGLIAGQNLFMDSPVISRSWSQSVNGGTSNSSPVSFVAALTSLAHARDYAASAVLADGRVFVFAGNAGGPSNYMDQIQLTSSTVLADGGRTIGSTITAKANAPSSVQRPSGSKLLDENLLFTGGYNGGPVNTTLFYDTTANTWATASAMSSNRLWHTQTTLHDGRALVCGGLVSATSSLATTEAFTSLGAGAGSWAAQASMGKARAGHTATLLADGRVLVCGGMQANGSSTAFPANDTQVGAVLADCEIYNPVSNTWTPTGDMAIARWRHEALLLADGRVLVCGGYGSDVTQPGRGFDTSVEIWDPVSGRWSRFTTLLAPHFTGRLAYLPTRQQVLVLGGCSDFSGTESPAAEIISLKTGRVCTSPGNKSGYGSLEAQVQVVNLAGEPVAVLASGSTGGTASAAVGVYIPGSDTISNGQGLTGVLTITSTPSPTSLVVGTGIRSYTHGTGARLMAMTEVVNATPIGPYVLDSSLPSLDYGTTSVTTGATIAKGTGTPSLVVADASAFPDAGGYVFLDFGGPQQQGPVRFFGKLNATTLILDHGYVFTSDLRTGATVTLVADRNTYTPDSEIGQAYLAANTSARGAAESDIDDSVAKGLGINKTILYPGDVGLGSSSSPSEGSSKLGDRVYVWSATNDPDTEIAAARAGI